MIGASRRANIPAVAAESIGVSGRPLRRANTMRRMIIAASMLGRTWASSMLRYGCP